VTTSVNALTPTPIAVEEKVLEDLRSAPTAGGLPWDLAFIARPREGGPGKAADLTATGDWDLIADSITGLAGKLEG
jgi:hypothetical protein